MNEKSSYLQLLSEELQSTGVVGGSGQKGNMNEKSSYLQLLSEELINPMGVVAGSGQKMRNGDEVR